MKGVFRRSGVTVLRERSVEGERSYCLEGKEYLGGKEELLFGWKGVFRRKGGVTVW